MGVMSEEDSTAKLEKAISRDLPLQTSATDTSSWDDKQSVDPSGEHYIRTTDEDE